MQAIAAFKAGLTHVTQYRAAERPLLTNWQALLDYLHVDMAHLAVERFRVLHLNTRNMLIRDDVITEGTIDHTPIHPREVVRRAIELGSAAIILVHNHPSGDPSPSRSDIDVTRNVAEVGKRLGIAVLDHVIVGASGHVSLRAQGLI
ncbi:DNA repair protein RadC [Sphingomonas gellani]|uniref:DNA repair protein RadC n=1 Tax=Sphingomonas gellani TaxID=1166340 RepID=A0A1H8CI98_9SPHN|nr:DNA repair protein RadC [Sphingomonas gellani]